MSPAGMLQARLTGTPPVVELAREASVPDDLWYALPVQLGSAAGIGSHPDGRRMTIPVERFLGGRRWLAEACRRYGVGLDFDADLHRLLARSQEEQAAVDASLAASPDEAAAAQAVVPDVRAATGSRFVRELRGFQERDLRKLLTLEHGANFSVPGAGKTSVAYAVYESARLAGHVDCLLVVAPLSAFEAWEVEAESCFSTPLRIQRFAGHIPHRTEVVLVNYQRLHNYLSPLAAWLLEGRAHLIIDEAHRMKRGRSGQWGTACLNLAPLARRRDILTGTPAPQGARDFIALVDFIWPDQSQRILPADALVADPPPEAMSDVSQAIKPLFVRTTKSELGLEEPHLHVEPVEMKPLQRDIYDALRARYAGMFDLSHTDRSLLAQIGEVTMYLLEAATNPRLLARHVGGDDAVTFRYPTLAISAGTPLSELIARYTDHEMPRKFEKLAALVASNAERGRKTLVWSNFIGNLLDLERLLAPYQPALIYGAIPHEEDAGSLAGTRTREGELTRFRGDDRCQVLLANPAAMAEGVSLHETCHDAIYLERTFNAGQYLQSLDRIHRLGLALGTETRITFLEAEASIDEAVDARVGVKAERLGTMLDDPDLVTMALPDDDDYGEVIEDVGDIAALFAHLEGAADAVPAA
jgi:SNF2 family DNA or RNA helicase